MINSMKRTVNAMFLGLGLLVVAENQADAGLILSYETAGVQASTVSGVTTENFNEAPAGVYNISTGASTAVGTLTASSVAIVNANLYGGAGNTGTYFAIGSESGSTTASLALNGAQQYFGFWWSAADSYNSISFYSGGKLLGNFSAATALAALGSSYNGNPNGTGDNGEKFAYLDVTATNGTTFDQVVFNNSSTGTGFESDNWSVKSTYTGPVSGTIIANGIVPEPSSIALVSIAGLVGGGNWLRGRRRGNRPQV